jgi:hypothetical protein
MFFISFTLLMGGVYTGSGVDTALVVEEQNPGYYTNGLIEILGERDVIPPSLHLIPMDAETAAACFANGDILLVVTIPDGFEAAVASNTSTNIHITVANIHEDLTKNLRMPVIRKLDIFYQTYLPDDAAVDFDVEDLRPFTPPRLGYMSWTLSIYAVMFASLYVGGSAMTQEFENDTFGEIELSGQSVHAIYIGKILSGVLLSYLALPLLFLLGYLAYGAVPQGNLLIFLVLTAVLATFCSSVGLALGAIFRNAVFMVPIAALSALFYWILGGGIAPLELAGVSFGILDQYVPISNIYRSAIRMFVENNYDVLFIDLGVSLVAAVLAVIVAPILAKRWSKVDFGRRFAELKQRRKGSASGG